MKKMLKIWSLGLFCMLLLSACGGGNSIVGTWVTEGDDDMLVFEEDGSCSAPFTYNSGWIESADHYAITEEDETLVFSSEGGHANDSYKKAKDEEEALDKSKTYYLSGNTLIIEGETYTRAK